MKKNKKSKSFWRTKTYKNGVKMTFYASPEKVINMVKGHHKNKAKREDYESAKKTMQDDVTWFIEIYNQIPGINKICKKIKK